MDEVEAKRRLRIRQATHADLIAAAQAQGIARQESLRGIVAQEELDRECAPETIKQVAESWAAQMSDTGAYLWIVTDNQTGTVVGVAQASPARDLDAPATLELVSCYVREFAQGSGVAAALLNTAIGDAPAYVWVPEGAHRAHAFFARHGFRAHGAGRKNSYGTSSICLLRLSN